MSRRRLTDYTIATDPRFKAAISGAGSALQFSMYGSDQYIRQYELEIGGPWKVTDAWIRISYPFFKADRITTPSYIRDHYERYWRGTAST
jgi:dipeptidyl aminopeptidase/acylaminoacyl peptidase